jgi:hypothetical protein
MIAPASVRGLALTPVKGTRLRDVESVTLERSGVREDRRFFLIDDRDRMVNGKHIGELTTVVADYSEPDRRLRLAFPDGRILEDEIRHDGAVSARFYSGVRGGRLVSGPWSEALSGHAGQSLRLVEAGDEGGVDRGPAGGASLISGASLRRLAEAAGEDEVDVRRFRMLIEVDGVDAHEEDGWVGRTVRVGEALIGFEGHVGRCLVTSRDPDTGTIDLPTLDILREYRGELETTEPLPFGIYGRVLEPGAIRLGDLVVADR